MMIEIALSIYIALLIIIDFLLYRSNQKRLDRAIEKRWRIK